MLLFILSVPKLTTDFFHYLNRKPIGFVYMHVYACVGMLHKCAYMHVCVGQRLALNVFLTCSLVSILRQTLSVDLRTFCYSSYPIQLAPGIPCRYSQVLDDRWATMPTWNLCVLMIHSNPFTPEQSLQPELIF